MKKILLLILAFITLSSCRFDTASNILEGIASNPFMPKVEISENFNEDEIHFLLFSDLHINRENEDFFAKERTEELMNHLKENKASDNPYDFIVSLGDIEDTGDIDAPELLEFLSFIQDNEIKMIAVLGNHDIQEFKTRKDWSDLYESYGIYGTLGSFSFTDDLTLYALDSTKRIYGRDQINYLEEALKNDSSKYKFFLTHVNTFSGSTVDLSLMFFGTADIQERNKIYSLMSDNGVNILFNGHFHKDTIITRHSDKVTEYNVSCAHTVNPSTTPGSLYDCTLSLDSGKLVIDIYQYNKSGILELSKSDTFDLQ